MSKDPNKPWGDPVYDQWQKQGFRLPLEFKPSVKPPTTTPTPDAGLSSIPLGVDLTGFSAPPPHYSQGGRETIDLIRDSMTDSQFVGFCIGNALKYQDRAKHKGQEQADMRKFRWYVAMASHVKGVGPDPRHERPNFTPYQRQPVDTMSIEVSEATEMPSERGSPWPPLSREQVVELHQELVEFYAGMKRCVDLGINDSARAAYAERLAIVLHRMGIGTTPPTHRTWTHEEVAKVAEEVQQDPPAPLRTVAWAKNTSGQPLREGQLVTADMIAVLPSVQPSRPEGQWEEPPLRNCWTCKHDLGFGHTTARYCKAMPARRRGERDSERHRQINAWTNAQALDENLMPPKDADGCPGWERK